MTTDRGFETKMYLIETWMNFIGVKFCFVKLSLSFTVSSSNEARPVLLYTSTGTV